jgi:hypothetical protein
LKGLTLSRGPDYSPVNTDVNNKTFEIEKDDQITLTVTVDPADTDIAGQIVWAGGGNFSGTGIEKAGAFSSGPKKDITAEWNGQSVSTGVYVNQNATSPISNATVTILNSKWAHINDEVVQLKASAKDNDWKLGALDSITNNIDLSTTAWSAPEGTLNVTIGEQVNWTPSKPAEDVEVSATFHDKDDSAYSPRNDSDVTASAKVGGFKVLVSLIVGGSGGTKHISSLDELGVRDGDALPAKFERALYVATGAFASVVPRGGPKARPNPDESKPEPASGDATITWTYRTMPPSAQPRGTISAELSTSGEGTMSSTVFDSDILDGDTDVDISISPFDLGFDVSTTITFGDNSEAVAALWWGFDSDDLGEMKQETNKHRHISSEEPDRFMGGKHKKDTPFSYTPGARVVTKITNQTSRAKWQSYAKCEAKTNNWKAEAEATLKDGTVSVNYRSVKYNKP